MKVPQLRLSVDRVIMTVAGLTLATSLYFLLEDGSMFDDAATSDLKPVGTFKVSNNDVRRRVDSGMTWSNVDAPEKVYEGDSIFTGDKSDASITLDNGNVIQVEPHSLVVIHTKGNKTTLDLQYGSLQGKIASADPIVIEQNGKTQELTSKSGSQIRIVKPQKEKVVRVQVTKGEVKVDNEEVKENEVVKITETKPVVEKATITPLSPGDGETKWLAMGSTLTFKWKSTGSAKADGAHIQFSRDEHFSSPLMESAVNGDHFATSQVPEGAFYWRIKPASGEPSLPSLATMYPDVPPMPVLPKDAQAFVLDNDHSETAKTVFFTWEDKSGSTEFNLQVARDKDFKDVVATKTGKEKVARVTDLQAGDYFWHVKGTHPSRSNAPYSRVMAFSVRQGAKAPSAPLLSSTSFQYTIPEATLAHFPAQMIKAGRGVKPVNLTPLTWKAQAESVQSYEVEVATDTDFTNSVRHDNGTNTMFAPLEVKPGALYMRVRTIASDGRVSPPSETATLTVSVPPPHMEKVKPVVATFKSDAELKAGQHEFSLSWQPQKFASAYELQWGSDPQFTKSKTFKMNETSRALKVTKPDSYAARVRALDADGHAISAFSPVEIASYRKEVFVPPPVVKPVVKATPVAPRTPASTKLAGLVSTLPTPQLREPASDTALVSLEDAPTFVTFKWKPFKGAAFYTIQISSDADFTNVVSEQKVKTPGFVFQKGLPEGKVFWRVRAHTKDGFSNWSDPSDINVIYQ